MPCSRPDVVRRSAPRGATAEKVGPRGTTVTLEPVEDRETLGRAWRDLETRSTASFFQSWAWIGCWLGHLPEDAEPRVLRVSTGARIIGMAILLFRRDLRHGLLVSNTLCLNETGDPRIDPLGMEYNGLLAEAGRAQEVDRAAIAWLVDHESGWDEFQCGGLATAAAQSLRGAAEASGLDCVIRKRQGVNYVDLALLRAESGDLLSLASRNTRYQVRRAMRLYESQGPLSFRAARSTGEALKILDELMGLHQGSWRARGHPGAFANPVFPAFHQALVAARFEAGEIQMLRITVGRQTIGCLYNLIHAGRVLAYQSGFRYDAEPKLKPGLVSHYLAVQHNVGSGAEIYDFMAGDAQYKKVLSTASATMWWLALQRPRLKLRLEQRLRRLKQNLLA